MPVLFGCKACKRKRRNRNAKRHLLTTECPVQFWIECTLISNPSKCVSSVCKEYHFCSHLPLRICWKCFKHWLKTGIIYQKFKYINKEFRMVKNIICQLIECNVLVQRHVAAAKQRAKPNHFASSYHTLLHHFIY